MMKVRTTININDKLLERLLLAVKTSGFDTETLISALMNHTGKRISRFPQVNIQIKYQDRGNKADWNTLHISPRPNEYEYYQDLRKIMKMSVSFIIAFAIEKYLDDLLYSKKMNMDNYRYQNYAITQIVHKTIICWVIYWGIPHELLDFST